MACIIHERLIGVDTTARLNITVDSSKITSAVPQPAESIQPLDSSKVASKPKSPARPREGQMEGARILFKMLSTLCR